ncbi:MAG: sigma-70 family polymerase sigma factor [Streptosporangiaceae bacterium]|nr:sigma-70 family polymerase sigma factor [Streptosporangiaceae bacterium]
MPDWPSISRVDDRRMAQSLRDGDPDALAQIVDGYAGRLFDYCHALLRDHDSAVYALHDGFIAAQAHIGRLREPERFRSWLYALVRNECLRRLNDPERPVERREAPEAEHAFMAAEERARRQETRELVHSALSGLTGRQREAVDLVHRHQLDTRELAGIVGVSGEQAAELADQAQTRLDDALTAAVIARSGRDDCPSAASLVEPWEWPLTPVACRKLIRHIGTCPTCGERRSTKVSTDRLLHVLPVALMPAGFGERVLTTATAPGLAGERTEIADWAGPFDVWGWPESIDAGPDRVSPTRPGPPRLWPAVAAGACVVLMVGAGFMWLPSSTHSPQPGAAAPAVSEPATTPSEPVSASPEPTPSVSITRPRTPPPTTRPPRPHTRRPSAKPTTRRPTTRPPRPGTLTVTGCGLITALECPLTLTAVGGTVSWRVTGTTGVTASGAGTLRPGGTTDVMVTRPGCSPGDASGSGTVTFSPNGSGAVSWTCEGAGPVTTANGYRGSDARGR